MCYPDDRGYVMRHNQVPKTWQMYNNSVSSDPGIIATWALVYIWTQRGYILHPQTYFMAEKQLFIIDGYKIWADSYEEAVKHYEIIKRL